MDLSRVNPTLFCSSFALVMTSVDMLMESWPCLKKPNVLTSTRFLASPWKKDGKLHLYINQILLLGTFSSKFASPLRQSARVVYGGTTGNKVHYVCICIHNMIIGIFNCKQGLYTHISSNSQSIQYNEWKHHTWIQAQHLFDFIYKASNKWTV